MHEPVVFLLLLLVALALFLFSSLRHDLIAVLLLLACVLLGLLPEEQAFSGFAHPAVITVACVLVLSAGVQQTGLLERVAKQIFPQGSGRLVSMGILCVSGAGLSAFMNNVGAMALLMPLALSMARRLDLPAGRLLMPLAFCTILGGMTTLIGTPPNLIVAGFRGQGSEPFQMFDFTPVGLGVALGGLLFVLLVGWRLVPRREGQLTEAFESGSYLTEAFVAEDSVSIGRSLRAIEQQLLRAELDAQVVGLIRNNTRLSPVYPWRTLCAGDTLVLESESDDLLSCYSELGLEIPQHEPHAGSELLLSNEASDKAESQVTLQEYVVIPGSMLLGRSADDIYLNTRFGLNLLALSRHGHRTVRRLRSTPLMAGDVLLLQGTPQAQSGFASGYGCLPLAQRDLTLPPQGKSLLALGILILAIALSASGLLGTAVAFCCGVVLFLLCGVLPVRNLYHSVDWSVIVLLGAMLPVADAMSQSGSAQWLVDQLLSWLPVGQPALALGLLLVLTMSLSDFINNAATAALMAPVALSLAQQLGVNPDTFLMAVAVGASCAFLTPIGHQNNTLILGPGGFRFGDYWRLGLPMELLVVGVSLPLLLVFWPL